MSKSRKIIGWSITGLLSALLLFSVVGKLALPEMEANFEAWGLSDWRIIIAIGELIATILFIIPRTNILGVFLLSSHMGGAILIHMLHGEPFALQSAVVVLIWITAFVRNSKLADLLKAA